MKIILINGPARSGKDSLANAFAKFVQDIDMTAEVVKFAGPLKEMTHRAFGLPEPHDSQEAVKDRRSEALFGSTPRKLYIGMSEMLMKPMFGQDIFGRMLADEIELLEKIRLEDGEFPADFYLVSDSGFAPEAQAVVDRFGAENIILVRLRREGYDFTGDSRGYISIRDVRALEFDLGPNLSELSDVVSRLFVVAQGRRA